jgi:hypothetical protein
VSCKAISQTLKYNSLDGWEINSDLPAAFFFKEREMEEKIIK